jgi:uncharacterized protein (DUF4415 family)
MNDDNTKYHTADGSPLTAADAARLDRLEPRLGDRDEIPETSDAAWSTAQRGKHARAAKPAISVQLDADVMAWLRAKGPSYRMEINRILREKMQSEA